MVTMAYHSIF